MTAKIIDRQEIILNSTQQKMVRSGWGNDCINNTIVEKITYSSDGLKVKGYIAYPKDQSQKYPCVIWCRGGFGEDGAIDEFNARGIYGQIASWGYVVFASQYRGNAGSEGKDEFGGSDVNDILNLVPLADDIDCADNANWAIEGWSRGGMMTYLILTRTNIFKCAITSGGIADLNCSAEENKYLKFLKEYSLEKNKSILEKKCKERSIIYFPEKLSKTTSLLLLHGTGDDRVSPHDSLNLSHKLLEQKIPFRLVMLEGGDHFLKSHRKEVDKMRKEWFDKYLKSRL